MRKKHGPNSKFEEPIGRRKKCEKKPGKISESTI